MRLSASMTHYELMEYFMLKQLYEAQAFIRFYGRAGESVPSPKEREYLHYMWKQLYRLRNEI